VLDRGAFRPSSLRRDALFAIGMAAASSLILVAHAVVLRADTALADVRSPRRYWEDTCVAAKRFLDHRYGPYGEAVGPSSRLEDAFGVCSRIVIGGAAAQEIRPWEFWRTIHLRPFLHFREYLVPLPPFSDEGRSALTAATFFLLGGVSPFAVLWVGVLFAIPVLFWISWESARAGVRWAGALLVLLLAGSPFFVECLTLPHGALGFYMLAIVGIAPLALYAALSPAVRPAGFLARALIAGALVTVCCVCRSASAAIVPGYVLALALGARRLETGRPRWLAFAAAVALLLGPYAAARPASQHDVWVTLWEGLGDFDRTKGHFWDDGELRRQLVAAGVPMKEGRFGFINEDSEAYLEQRVLGDIASDPLWYARILVRRVWATATQEKLRAWSSMDWRAIAASLSPYEDGMRKNFSWATPVNRLGSGRMRVTVPVLALLAPTLALLALAAARGSGPRIDAARHTARRALWPMACVAAGALALPVIITTAGLLETEAFSFVYVLGIALLAQAAADAFAARPYAEASASSAAASR
jgi:hypothetical protein